MTRAEHDACEQRRRPGVRDASGSGVRSAACACAGVDRANDVGTRCGYCAGARTRGAGLFALVRVPVFVFVCGRGVGAAHVGSGRRNEMQCGHVHVKSCGCGARESIFFASECGVWSAGKMGLEVILTRRRWCWVDTYVFFSLLVFCLSFSARRRLVLLLPFVLSARDTRAAVLDKASTSKQDKTAHLTSQV
jgi:hypothetical protein